MKVFISWSGDVSHRVAASIAEWLPNVIQRAKPFLSSGIPKGVRWSAAIAHELEEACFGIICVTQENMQAPWLLFEAGAISKTLSGSFVAPLLINVSKDKLSGSPLSQFQMSDLVHSEILSLLKSVNSSDQDTQLDTRRLEVAFEAFWPKLEEQVKDLIRDHPAVAAETSTNAVSSPANDCTQAESPLLTAVDDFEAAVAAFQKSDDFNKEAEYWTAAFASRRHDLGLPQQGESLEQLDANDERAFWPKYFLASRALAAEDVTSARKFFAQLPHPTTSRKVNLYADLSLSMTRSSKTYIESLADLRHLLSSDFDDLEKASIIERFAERSDDAHGALAVALLRDFATRSNPSDIGMRFNLAHQLGEHRGLQSVSYYNYKRLTGKPENPSANSENNMAILSSIRGLTALAYDYYEKSIRNGNQLASANLTSNLIDAGYFSGAAAVLKDAPLSGPYDINIATAKQKLEKAQEKMTQDAADFWEAAKLDQSQFSHFAQVCVRAWTADVRLSAQKYVASKEQLTILFPEDGAPSAQFMENGKLSTCELVHNGVCYEGTFHAENAVANGFSKKVLVSPSDEEADVASAIVYNGLLPTQRIEQFTLTKKE